MELSYIQFDERLDAVQFAELRAPKSVQKRFRNNFLLSWLYHELSVEGVVLHQSDLERAMAGRDGRDYCDGELLKAIRRYREALRRLSAAAAQREPVSRSLIFEYQAVLSGRQGRNAVRSEDGPTEQYKHSVLPADEIDDALRALVADVREQSERLHPIELAVQTHYRFVKIWPFEEHSAAVARLVANQILYSNGYPPAILCAHDRQRYYHALHYDMTRLHDLVMESLRGQIELRERLFRKRRESVVVRAAL